MNLSVEYDNRARVPEHPEIIARWQREAEIFRIQTNSSLDIAYGARPRNRLDLFRPEKAEDGAVVLFIHGGYWRSFDKSLFSHMAAASVSAGFVTAIPSYSLCPEATVPDIIDELRQCCLYLWKEFGQPLVVAGHSAGGHLAACMAATDWTQYGLSCDFVRGCFPVSGLFDLRPLLATPINEDLRLTATSAAAASPILWPLPQPVPLVSLVGALESREFLRQAASLSAAWQGLGCLNHYHEIESTNHFTVTDGLSDPKSAMSAMLAGLCRSVWP
jgi:arylformamidase